MLHKVKGKSEVRCKVRGYHGTGGISILFLQEGTTNMGVRQKGKKATRKSGRTLIFIYPKRKDIIYLVVLKQQHVVPSMLNGVYL